VPSFWIILVFDITGAIFAGIALVATTNLVLEQIPQARGTMMSLTQMSASLGTVIGVIVGGAILDAFTTFTNGPVLNPNGFSVLLAVLSVFGIAAITLNYLFIKDPFKKSLSKL
jgi:MFS family permease